MVYELDPLLVIYYSPFRLSLHTLDSSSLAKRNPPVVGQALV